MKVFLLLRCMLFSGLIVLSTAGYGQTLTAVPDIHLTSNLNGLYEYLPQSYSSDPLKVYPLYIMLGGSSQKGNGNSDLPNVFKASHTGPWQIDQGIFPKSFTSDGQEVEFVIIMPQFIKDPVVINSTVADMDALIQYCIDRYGDRIDPKKIYLSGISSGGGLILDYASRRTQYGEKIAAGVVLSPALPPSQEKADTLAKSKIPLWITVGDKDIDIYPLAGEWMDYFANTTPTYLPFPKYSVFPGIHTAAWTTISYTSYTENGLNMYQWMLQYDRYSVVPVSGMELSATANNNNVLLKWKTASETSNSGFEVQKSADGAKFEKIGFVNAGAQNGAINSYSFNDMNPISGTNFYRIKQIDKDGHATLSKVVSANVNSSNAVNVYPNPTAAKLYIKGTFSGKVKVQIFDANGKSVQLQSVDGGSNLQVNVNNLPKGVYSGTISSSNKRSDFTFVKN